MPGPEISEPENPDPEMPLAVAEAAGDHVRIETAVDRARPGGAGDLTGDGAVCPSSARLDLASWGYLTEGQPDLAAYREGLVDELDKTDPKKAFSLAKYYVYLTFGAEALALLAEVPQDQRDRDLVAAMAEIMDRDRPARPLPEFSGFESCASAAALWAVLAGAGLRPGQAVDTDAVVQAFGDLPDHAMRHLGPRLVDAFREAGRIEVAEILRNRMNLAGPGAEIAVAVANAQLDEAGGDHHRAATVLETALRDADPESPEALLALAETQIAAGRSVDAGLLAALETLAYQLRGEPLGRRIDHAIAVAYLSRGEFLTARDRALSPASAFDRTSAADLIRRVYAQAAEKAAPAEFLRLVLPLPAGLEDGAADDPVRRALADRLLAMGFAEDALAQLAPLAAEDPAARLIAGRAHLALGRPDAAIAALSALPPDQAAPLLARAQDMAGRFALARGLYDRAGAPDDAVRMAVLLRDWPEVARRAAPPIREMAGMLATPAPPPDPGATPYAAADALIAQSQRERAAIADLLAAE
jgi:thioredoxin-like negative regulator of GroEL